MGVRVEVEDAGLEAHVLGECVGYEGVLQVGVEGHGEWEGLNEVREAREVVRGGEVGDSLLVQEGELQYVAQPMGVWKAYHGAEDPQVLVGDHAPQEDTPLVGQVGTPVEGAGFLNESDDLLPHGVVDQHGVHHDEVGFWANFCFETW